LKKIRWIFFLVMFCGNSFAHAKTLDLLPDARPVPSVLNGTLNPSFLSLNGDQISTTDEKVEALELNGQRVETKDEAGLQVISEQTDRSELKLAWILVSGKRIPIQELNYPSLTVLSLGRKSLIVEVNDFALVAKVDDTEVPLLAKKGVLLIEDSEHWLGRPHLITLLGKSGSNRIYHLDSAAAGHDFFPESIASFSIAEPLYAGNGNEFALNYSEKIKKHGLAEVALGYASGFPYYPHDPSSTYHAYTLYLKPLWEPFVHEPSILSIKRIGVGANLVLRYLKVSNGGSGAPGQFGIATPTSRFDFIYAPVLRFEPIVWHNFGLIFEFSYYGFTTREQLVIDSTRIHSELSYHW
jgi:hypothetical protein